MGGVPAPFGNDPFPFFSRGADPGSRCSPTAVLSQVLAVARGRPACSPRSPWLWRDPGLAYLPVKRGVRGSKVPAAPLLLSCLRLSLTSPKVKLQSQKKHPPPAKKKLKSHTHTHTHLPRLKKEEQEANLVHARVHAVQSWAATPSAETDHLALSGGGHRPPPADQACRPRAPAPSPDRWGCRHSEAGGTRLGAGSVFGALALGVPAGARVPPTARVSP